MLSKLAILVILLGYREVCALFSSPTKCPTFLPTYQPTETPTDAPTTTLPSIKPTVKPTPVPTIVPTAVPTIVPSALPTFVPTVQPSRSPSRTPTIIPTLTPSIIPTLTPSITPSLTPSIIPTLTPSIIPTLAPTVIPTVRPTIVPSIQPTVLPTVRPTFQPTGRPSSQPSSRPSKYPSSNPSSQPSRQPTTQPSSIPTTPTSKPSRQPSSRPSNQPSTRPSLQPSAQPSRRPSGQPSIQPSTQPSSRPTQPTSKPSTQPSRQPSSQPSSRPSCLPSSVPSAKPSHRPSSQPSSRPSMQPSSQPSRQPSLHPSSLPTEQPSSRPSRRPTSQPSGRPSHMPSTFPSAQPSVQPSSQPSLQPFSHPSALPSVQPSGKPSLQPFSRPSAPPTSQPSTQPSMEPSNQPTSQPTLQPFSKPSGRPTSQPSSLPSEQPSVQPSSEPSAQPSVKPSHQPSSQPSSRPSQQPFSHPSALPTMQPSGVPSLQPFSRPSSLPSMQPSGLPSGQPTIAPSIQPSAQPAALPTSLPSVQPSSSPSQQPTSQPTCEPSGQPSALPTMQPSAQPISHPSAQPSVQPSGEPSGQPSSLPSGQPSIHPSAQPSKSPSSQPTGMPTVQPSTVPFVRPTSQPSCAPTSQPSVQPTGEPSGQPSMQPSFQPSSQPSEQPSAQPSVQPSGVPSGQPTVQPSVQPSAQPQGVPTNQPSVQPTKQPTGDPSTQPTGYPSTQPSGLPTIQPSSQPTAEPSGQPSCMPSQQPTVQPTMEPSGQPSMQPSFQPSTQPSGDPSGQPSMVPSGQPSIQPSCQPTSTPTQPTSQPSGQPTRIPSRQPTSQPSDQPTSRPSPYTICPPGHFFNLTGHTDLFYNTSGIYNLTQNVLIEGQPWNYSVCKICPAGTWSNVAVDHCHITPKGHYSPENSVMYFKCPLNHYAQNNGSAICKKCPKHYVNGLQGSFSRKECVNTSINFVFGSVCIVGSIIFIGIYLFWGRLHKIAFQRRFRLVRKCVMMYGAMMTTADMTNLTMNLLDHIGSTGRAPLWKRIWTSIILPYVLWPMIFTTVIAVVTAFYVFRTTIRIIFNTMVLWRAYQHFHIWYPDLESVVKPLEHEVGLILDHIHIPGTWYRDLVFPIIWVYKRASSIHINFNSVKVTCTGAQSPLYLATDLFIVFVVIIIIESEVHVFWSMMLTNALNKMRSMVFNRHYFFTWTNFVPSVLYLGLATCIAQIPPPSSLIQYCMGFVVISSFFNFSFLTDGTGSWVPYSPNCNGAAKVIWKGQVHTLPIDSVLANASAVCAIFMLPIIVYLVSVVLFAHKEEANKKADGSSSWEWVTYFGCIPVPSWSTPAATTSQSKKSSNFGQSEEKKEPGYHSLCGMVPVPCWLTKEENKEDGARPSMMRQSTMSRSVRWHVDMDQLNETEMGVDMNLATTPTGRRARAMTRAASVKELAYEEKKGFTNFEVTGKDIEEENEEEKQRTWASWFFAGFKSVVSIFSVDWLLLYLLFQFGRRFFGRLKRYLSTKKMVTAPKKVEVTEKKEVLDDRGGTVTIEEKTLKPEENILVYEDAYEYDPELERIRYYVQKVELCTLTMSCGISVDKEFIAERKLEKKEWEEVDQHLPSYFKMALDVRGEMKQDPWMDQWMPWGYQWMCYFMPAQILLTKKGREHWYRVGKTYYGMLCVSIGYWPTWLVEDFKIIEKYKEFNTTSQELYAKVGTEMFKRQENEEKRTGDIFTEIDNDERMAFADFVASITTCRIALMQIIPILTVYSVFAGATASTPLFVFNEEMNNLLPPLFVLDAWVTANKLLVRDMGVAPFFQWLFLGYYIFIGQSRAIQFFINGYIYFIALAIYFWRRSLKIVIPILVFLVVHQGLLTSGYVVLLFKKLLFPFNKKKEKDAADEAENGPNQGVTLAPGPGAVSAAAANSSSSSTAVRDRRGSSPTNASSPGVPSLGAFSSDDYEDEFRNSPTRNRGYTIRGQGNVGYKRDPRRMSGYDLGAFSSDGGSERRDAVGIELPALSTKSGRPALHTIASLNRNNSVKEQNRFVAKQVSREMSRQLSASGKANSLRGASLAEATRNLHEDDEEESSPTPPLPMVQSLWIRSNVQDSSAVHATAASATTATSGGSSSGTNSGSSNNNRSSGNMDAFEL